MQRCQWWVDCNKISKSAHLNAAGSWLVGTPSSTPTKNASLKTLNDDQRRQWTSGTAGSPNTLHVDQVQHDGLARVFVLCIVRPIVITINITFTTSTAPRPITTINHHHCQQQPKLHTPPTAAAATTLLLLQPKLHTLLGCCYCCCWWSVSWRSKRMQQSTATCRAQPRPVQLMDKEQCYCEFDR